jgi:hypothetical protein
MLSYFRVYESTEFGSCEIPRSALLRRRRLRSRHGVEVGISSCRASWGRSRAPASRRRRRAWSRMAFFLERVDAMPHPVDRADRLSPSAASAPDVRVRSICPADRSLCDTTALDVLAAVCCPRSACRKIFVNPHNHLLLIKRIGPTREFVLVRRVEIAHRNSLLAGVRSRRDLRVIRAQLLDLPSGCDRPSS